MATNVRVTELDFDTLKENFKTYLRTQSQFTDFDFDASNLNVLMDLLAYNTHYNAVLANMLSNEMFLDTALKRSSVVSLAKHLDYVPRSRRSATSLVNIILQSVPGTPNFLTLNPYTLFTTYVDGTTYTFYNPQSYTTTPISGVYTFTNVRLYQGRKLDFYYTVGASSSPASKYVIPNANVDTATLQVVVQPGGVGQFTDVYTLAENASEVTNTSKVYYLQENTDGLYEIYFGDDVLGVNLNQNDIIKINYIVTDGVDANVSNTIAVSWDTNSIAGESIGNRSIQTVSNPSGGGEKETIDSIRFNALNNYSAQNRAITENDYAGIISAQIPGADSVNIWGGEKNTPPVYGKTFISIKPKTGYVLSTDEKNHIINDILKPRSVITAQHEFVDPTYTYMTITATVRYASSRTSRTSAEISSLVNASIQTFISTNLAKFNAIYYNSQLEETIANLDDSILSVNVTFKLQKRLPLVANIRFAGTQVIQYPARVHPNQLRTSYFYFTDYAGQHVAQVRDVPDVSPPDYNGTGTLKTIDINTGDILDATVGTVNYATGKVTLNSASPLTISGYPSTLTAIYASVGVQEGTADVYPGYNEILVLDDNSANAVGNVENGININVIAVNN